MEKKVYCMTIKKPYLLGLGRNPCGCMTCGGLGALDVELYEGTS